MNPAGLRVDELTGGYGGISVLHGLSLAVDPGESIGLVGPNGHGKTTLLRHISGLNRARGGSIVLDDVEITRRRPDQIIELGFVQVPQGSRLFPECSVLENLELGCYSKRARTGRAESLERVFALFPKLRDRRTQLCGTLSGGERQMVAIGIGLMAEPRLLALDEPTLGLAPSVKEELLAAINEIRRSGISLILIDGDLAFVLALTDRWYGVESGRVFATGTSAEGLRDEVVAAMYFGTVTHG